MKKTKRLLALLMAVLLCLSLCGCDRLDELRKMQGFWQEDGSILWNGHVYKRLPTVLDNINLDSNHEDISVTKKDVPVLLSVIVGDGFSVGRGGILLDGYMPDTDAIAHYCRADKYEQVCGMATDDFAIATYGYEYYDFETGTYKDYVLTKEQKDRLAKIYSTAKKREQTYEENGEYEVSIYGYSADDLFCRYLFGIVKNEKGVLTLQDDEYIYTVSKVDYPFCEEVMKTYMDSLYGEGLLETKTAVVY